VQALIKSKRKPVLSQENFPLSNQAELQPSALRNAKIILTRLNQLTTDLAASEQALVQETVEMLKIEVDKTPQNKALIRALIANLRPYQSLTAERVKLADVLDVELI